jgi:nucleoid-associated protein YgaU
MKVTTILTGLFVCTILLTSSLRAQVPGVISPPDKGEVLTIPAEAYKIEEPFLYAVAPGDNLHWLAAKFYGDARLWTRIYDANKGEIRNPNVLEVGQKLTIPANTQSP